MKFVYICRPKKEKSLLHNGSDLLHEFWVSPPIEMRHNYIAIRKVVGNLFYYTGI